MKYPELRLSMETALPPSIQSWLGHELEIRGIDSVIYSRYIVQLLQEDDVEELGCPDYMDLIFSQKLDGKKVKTRKSDKHKTNSEDRKKSAAIECLQAVSEEDSGIETLVEELCYKLKEISSSSGTEGDTDTTAEASCSSTDSSDNSSSEFEDPAERYYAAFPALQGQDKQQPCSSPFDKDSIHVWQNNPITNVQACGDDGVIAANVDSGNESENESPPKYKKKTQIQIPGPRKKKHGKKYSTKGYPMKKSNRSSAYMQRGRSVPNESEKKDITRIQRLSSWPQQTIYYNTSAPSSPPESQELCYKVESLLKEILLPPSKHAEQMGHGDIRNEDNFEGRGNTVWLVSRELTNHEIENSREESVSPELRENDSWYTQPLEGLFQPEEPCHPLYQRHSYPLLTDTGERKELQEETDNDEVFASTLSSPLISHSYSDSSFIKQEILCELASFCEGSNQFQNDDLISDHEDIDCISSVLASSLGDDDDEPICLSPPVISGKPIDTTSCLDQKAAKNSCGSSTSNSSSASYATVAEKIRDYEEHKDDSSSPSQLCPVLESLENPVFMDMPTLLDRDYLYRITSAQLNLTPTRHFLWSPTSVMVSSTDTVISDLGWPSKVLFDDQLQLPPNLYQNPWELSGSSTAFRSLMQGKLSWQLWDVNYQNQPRSTVYPWRFEELWDFGCARQENVWTTTNIIGVGCWFDDLTWKSAAPVSNTFDNTLIPQITFDLAQDDLNTDDVFIVDDDTDDDEDILNNLLTDEALYQGVDRSLSLGDFQMLWSIDERDCMMSKPQLSRSFELVPSEHSAFEDVPKIHHVHSEPNLKYFCEVVDSSFNMLQLQTDESPPVNKTEKQSPEEHLYYSPKTHFRPIQTPVENQEAVTDFHLRDLFGGYSKTNKTPYQKYQDHGSDSGEEGFVPKFKIRKDQDKYIQTGDSTEADTCVSTDPQGIQTYDDREIDELVQAIAAQGCMCIDGDVTSPVLEDYSEMYMHGYVDSLTTSQLNTPQNVEYWNQACSDSGYEEAEVVINAEEERAERRVMEKQAGEDFANTVLDNQINLGQNTEESINKQKDVSGGNDKVHGGPFPKYFEGDPDDTVASSFQEIGSWFFSDTWSVDRSESGVQQAGLHHPSIWNSKGEEVPLSDISGRANYLVDNQNLHHAEDETSADGQLENCNFIPVPHFPEEEGLHSEGCLDSSESQVAPASESPDGIVYPSAIQQSDGDCAALLEEADVVKVKLVYKKAARKPQNYLMQEADGDQLLDPQTLMPMPTQAVYSSELEKEWLNSDSFPPPIYYKPNKNLPKDDKRKPCSFFMEGNCRRSDCKFAHDLSLITCKFWEEGDCFKGEMCPFLHGYIRRNSNSGLKFDGIKSKYEFQLEDFPELSSKSKDQKGTEVNKSKKGKTISPKLADYKKSRRTYRKSSEEKRNKCMDRPSNRTDVT